MKWITTLVLLIGIMASAYAQTDLKNATSLYQQSKSAFIADYTSQEEFVAGMQLADSLIDESLKLDQTNADAFLVRAKLFAMTKTWSRAEEALNFAIGLDDTVPEYYMRRGMTRNILKMRAEASYDLNKAIQLDPEYAEAYFHLGYWYYGGALDAEACSHWSKAKELGYAQADVVLANYCGG